MSERLSAEEGGYVLCRVEGCPRTTDEGWDQRCGLAKLGIHMASPLCGSDASVAAWLAAGLLDILEPMGFTDEDHREISRGAQP